MGKSGLSGPLTNLSLSLVSYCGLGYLPQIFFGLPGKPAGCYLCFNLYVAAALRKKLGREPRVPNGRGLLAQDFDKHSERVLFLPSAVTWENQRRKVRCLTHGGTGGIFPILSANAYAAFEPDTSRRGGDEVAFELMQPMP